MGEDTNSGGHGKNPERSELEEPKSLPGPFLFCGNFVQENGVHVCGKTVQ